MTIYSADEIHKALSLYTKCRDANDRSGGKLFGAPMDEEIPSNLAVLADYNKVFDALIDEGVLNDRPNGEELEKFIRGLLPPKNKPEIHYFEVYFGDRKSYEEDGQPSICIKGIRQPSVEEANEFCKVDSYCIGQPVTEVVEINGDYAENCFCLDTDQKLPVFGIDAPKSLADAGFEKWEFPLSMMGVTIVGVVIIYAKTRSEAISALNETMTASPELVFAHIAKCGFHAKFIAADHGGIEPLPPDVIWRLTPNQKSDKLTPTKGGQSPHQAKGHTMKYHVAIHFDFAGNCEIEANSEEQAVAIAKARINAGQITPDDIDLDPTGEAKATIAGYEDRDGEIVWKYQK